MVNVILGCVKAVFIGVQRLYIFCVQLCTGLFNSGLVGSGFSVKTPVLPMSLQLFSTGDYTGVFSSFNLLFLGFTHNPHHLLLSKIIKNKGI